MISCSVIDGSVYQWAGSDSPRSSAASRPAGLSMIWLIPNLLLYVSGDPGTNGRGFGGGSERLAWRRGLRGGLREGRIPQKQNRDEDDHYAADAQKHLKETQP